MGEGADPGGGVWAAGESCEERGEGVDVKVKVRGRCRPRWRSLGCRGGLWGEGRRCRSEVEGVE